MITQTAKAARFKALHEQEGMFLLPNPWDVGSAKILEGLGFQALATTSAGFALSKGFSDYEVTRDMVMEHIREISAASGLPLNADLENGFGHDAETCAETIRLGAAAGLVGGSIEDFTGTPGQQYEIAHAADRVRAAVEAAEAQSFPFLLTARAENFFTGVPDLADTIARLQAYQEAGAHVLYAPGLRTLDDIRAVIASVDRPVNVLLGPRSGLVPMSEIAATGARRVSLGSVLANAAFTGFVEAAKEFLHEGTLTFLGKSMSGKTLADIRTGSSD